MTQKNIKLNIESKFFALHTFKKTCYTILIHISLWFNIYPKYMNIQDDAKVNLEILSWLQVVH